MLYVFIAVFLHTQILFPTTTQASYQRCYMFRLSVVAVVVVLQYDKDTGIATRSLLE